MNNPRNWLVLLVASAVAGTFAVQCTLGAGVPPASPLPATEEIAITEPLTETPSPDAPYGQCAYMWAYKDIPGLTEKVNTSIRALDPSASARAEAFGEDCVYESGQRVFGAMETDFYIYLPVSDLTNEEAFGNWIMQVMPVVLDLPAEELKGPMPGFAEFWFTKSDTEQLIVRVPIQQYQAVAPGKTGIEIFRFFHIPSSSPT